MRAKILIQGTLVRTAYGVLSLLFPDYLFGAVGMKDVDPEARYLNRLFGGRDLLVAGMTLGKVKSGHGKSAVFTNLVCEATDTVGLVEELRTRGKLERSLIIGLLFNVVGYVTWIRALLAGGPKAAETPDSEE
jgi:hypothetical protein